MRQVRRQASDRHVPQLPQGAREAQRRLGELRPQSRTAPDGDREDRAPSKAQANELTTPPAPITPVTGSDIPYSAVGGATRPTRWKMWSEKKMDMKGTRDSTLPSRRRDYTVVPQSHARTQCVRYTNTHTPIHITRGGAVEARADKALDCRYCNVRVESEVTTSTTRILATRRATRPFAAATVTHGHARSRHSRQLPSPSESNISALHVFDATAVL